MVLAWEVFNFVVSRVVKALTKWTGIAIISKSLSLIKRDTCTLAIMSTVFWLYPLLLLITLSEIALALALFRSSRIYFQIIFINLRQRLEEWMFFSFPSRKIDGYSGILLTLNTYLRIHFVNLLSYGCWWNGCLSGS